MANTQRHSLPAVGRLRKPNSVNSNELSCTFLKFLNFKCLIWECRGENNYILSKGPLWECFLAPKRSALISARLTWAGRFGLTDRPASPRRARGSDTWNLSTSLKGGTVGAPQAVYSRAYLNKSEKNRPSPSSGLLQLGSRALPDGNGWFRGTLPSRAGGAAGRMVSQPRSTKSRLRGFRTTQVGGAGRGGGGRDWRAVGGLGKGNQGGQDARRLQLAARRTETYLPEGATGRSCPRAQQSWEEPGRTRAARPPTAEHAPAPLALFPGSSRAGHDPTSLSGGAGLPAPADAARHAGKCVISCPSGHFPFQNICCCGSDRFLRLQVGSTVPTAAVTPSAGFPRRPERARAPAPPGPRVPLPES